MVRLTGLQMALGDAVLHEIIERSPFGIYVVDARLRIQAMNRRSIEGAFANVRPLVGRSLDEALRVLWPDALASGIVEQFRIALDKGEPLVGNFSELRNDTGRVESYEWELHRIGLPDAAGPGVVCYFSDVTAQRATEQALHDSEARQHRLVDGASDYAIIELSRDGTIIYWNRGAERLLGWSEAEVIGESGSIFFNFEDRRRRMPERELETAAALGRSSDERWHVRKDGTRFWGSGLVMPLKDEAGREVIGFVKIFQDRTRQREAQAALEEIARQRADLLAAERAARLEAERIGRMKDEFLATLSHELRTPLHAIVGWSDILERNRSDESVAAGIKVIRRNAKLQQQLIEELLDMSRIMSGRLKLELGPVSLREVLLAALDAVTPAAIAKGIRLEFAPGDGTEAVTGDAARLQQVFVNLLTNGVKFTPGGGVVRLQVDRDEDACVRVTVADSGQGISADFLPFVFDRFRQEDASRTRRYSGLGIGLAIVKQIVTLHGGSVRASSAGPDRGATFSVRLPLAVDAAAGAPPSPAATPPEAASAQFAGRRILLVDDDPDALALNERMLRERGAELLVAHSAGEALDAVVAARPELIVSDIGMPEVDGYELMRRIRALPHGQGGSIRGIALTAYARPEDREQALAAGYDAYLTKPVALPALLDTIRSMLRGT